MEQYVGLDVSLKETSICVVEASGEIVFEGRVMSEPDAMAAVIGEKAGSVELATRCVFSEPTWLPLCIPALNLAPLRRGFFFCTRCPGCPYPI